MLGVVGKLAGDLKGAWEGKAPVKAAAQPATEAVKPPEVRVREGPRAVVPPYSAGDRARWAALRASGMLLAEEAEAQAVKYGRICSLHLAAQKSGEETGLDPKIAWNQIEDNDRLAKALIAHQCDIYEFLEERDKKLEEFCILASERVEKAENDASELRMGRLAEIDVLKKGFAASMQESQERIAILEKGIEKPLASLRLKCDGEALAAKEANRKEIEAKDEELRILRDDHRHELAAKDSERGNAVAVLEEKFDEKQAELEKQLADMDGLEKAAREEIRELKEKLRAKASENRSLSDGIGGAEQPILPASTAQNIGKSTRPVATLQNTPEPTKKKGRPKKQPEPGKPKEKKKRGRPKKEK